MQKQARRLCDDPSGFDRAKWHSSMNRAVAAFFTKTLGAGAK
jgi:hypothetical protein